MKSQCDGQGPHSKGEVRLLRYGADCNGILCRLCYLQEMSSRRLHNKTYPDNPVEIPKWESLKVYGAVPKRRRLSNDESGP